MVDLVLDIVLKIIICRNLIKEHALIVSGKKHATRQLYFQIGSAQIYTYIHSDSGLWSATFAIPGSNPVS